MEATAFDVESTVGVQLTQPSVPSLSGSMERPGGCSVEAVHVSARPGAIGPAFLERISFFVPPRGSLAVVGNAGSGKSTLLDAITGRCEIDSGSVRKGDISDANVRRYMPGLPLFASTPRLQLQLDSDQPLTEEEMLAMLMGCDVGGWRLGLDTPCVELPASDREMLSLARTLMPPMTDILVLDMPPTRALKNILAREAVVVCALAAIDAVAYGDLFDEVILLDKGRVAKRGNATYLMEDITKLANATERFHGSLDQRADTGESWLAP